MKIALCGRFNTEKKHQGGSAEVFLTLAELLSRNNEVTLFGRGKPTQDIVKMCKKNNIKFYYIPSDTILNIFLGPFRALRLLKKHWGNFDIIHTHTGSFAWASTFFRKKCKIITHIHEISIPNKNSIPITIYMYLQNFLLKRAARNSDLVITVSNYMANLIRKEWGIKRQIILNIPNGSDLNIFKPLKKEDYKLDLYNGKYKKLMFVGRLTRRKGILDLLEAFEKIEDSNYRLLIVGYGDLTPIVKDRIKDDFRIKLIDYVKKDKLPEYYNEADLVIVPSHYEPGALVPRESLACGTPVLLANNTGLKEIKIAYFFNKFTSKEIANKIINLFSKKLISKNICRAYAEENYDWNKIVIKYEKEYKKIVQGGV